MLDKPMGVFPDVLTHNYDPARGLAKNLCNLPKAQAEELLDEIRAFGKRAIKRNYLKRRLVTEDWLIAGRQEKLGPTPLLRPIYFFLGNFADGKDPSRPASLVMPLNAFDPAVLTFTYPDSMASLPIATEERHRVHRRPYHGQIFTLLEIRAVVAQFGLPGQGSENDTEAPYDTFIEVQLWDDRPIRAFLASL